MKTEISAGGVVIRQNRNKKYVAMQQVQDKKAESSGWFLPKGHIENEEDKLATAKRETREEVGARNLELIKYLGKKERNSRTTGVWKVVHYYLFVAQNEILIPEAADKDHIAKWIEIRGQDISPIPEQNEVITQSVAFINKL